MADVKPEVLAEVRRLLEAAGWSVRKLRAAGLSARAAEALLGKNESTPSVESLERALRLLEPPRGLWHRPAR